MRLLIATQKVDENDAVLGFFHGWIGEFAKHCEYVTVICLEKGAHHLPENVKVLSLGKEKKHSRLQYLARFYRYIWQERKNYDTVFVHMNPEYVVLGSFFWKLAHKKTALWYTHKQVNLKLRIAEKVVDKIFTVTKESFQLKSKKVNSVGHGIDLESFVCEESKRGGDVINILHVGRITSIKNCDILVEAAEILKKKWNKNFSITFIGAPAMSKDEEYFKRLKRMVSYANLQGNVTFLGNVPNKEIKKYYCDADLIVNLSPEGLSDKVVFEAMASGSLVLVSNKSFLKYFGEYGGVLVFKERDSEDLSNKIMKIFEIKNKNDIKDFLFKKAQDVASLPMLINKIFVVLFNKD